MDSTTRLRRTRSVIGRLRRISEIAEEEEYLWQVLVSDCNGTIRPRPYAGSKLIRQLAGIHCRHPVVGHVRRSLLFHPECTFLRLYVPSVFAGIRSRTRMLQLWISKERDEITIGLACALNHARITAEASLCRSFAGTGQPRVPGAVQTSPLATTLPEER